MNLWENRKLTPMLLSEDEKPFDSKDYLFELKFDGIRALIFVSPTSIQIKSRNQKDITNLFPELEGIKKIVKKNVLFDGEIVIMDNGVPKFSKIQERLHLKNKSKIKRVSLDNPAVFVSFDILYEDKNLINLSLEERKILLDKYLDNNNFVKSKYIRKNGKKLFSFVKKNNLEGIVAKKIDSTYEINKRTDTWIKIKNIKDSTFYIGGYQEKENSYVISLLLGEYKNNLLYYVGKVSLGKKHSLYKKVKDMEIQKKSSFVDFKEDKYIFINPSIKCNVSYLEKTRNNHLRHPVIKY